MVYPLEKAINHKHSNARFMQASGQYEDIAKMVGASLVQRNTEVGVVGLIVLVVANAG